MCDRKADSRSMRCKVPPPLSQSRCHLSRSPCGGNLSILGWSGGRAPAGPPESRRAAGQPAYLFEIATELESRLARMLDRLARRRAIDKPAPAA